MTENDDLVSVVVPAYNAADTLGETLMSVRGQSYANLEIVVVDDGSTDDTVSVARAHAAEDDRIRIISIENGGVAAARNAGVAASRGSLVAPIDADDLWHPEKIARQIAIMRAGGPNIGYVYTLYRRIDVDGRVLYNCGHVPLEGHIYLRLLFFNCVGNGSSLLIRRAALEAVGGYEPDLRRQGAQGCEDYLLQILIARNWKVGRLPEYLTGYRKRPGAMSDDWERMARSRLMMLDHVARRIPETPAAEIAAARSKVRTIMAIEQLRRRQPAKAALCLWSAMRFAPSAALSILFEAGRFGAARLYAARSPGAPANVPPPRFLDVDPRDVPQQPRSMVLRRRIARLAERELAFFADRPAAPTTACSSDGAAPRDNAIGRDLKPGSAGHSPTAVVEGKSWI